MKKHFIICLLFIANLAMGQSSIILPNGTVIPSMTQANRPTTNLTVGQLIYQTDGVTGLYVWNGTAWTAVAGSGGNGSVTNVAADAPLSVTNPTTTPTISMPQANATTNGFLSSADWSNFNNKYTLPNFNAGSLLFSNGTNLAQNNSKLFWDNSNFRLGVGVGNPSKTVDVSGTGGLRVSSTTIGLSPVDWIAGDFGGNAGSRVVMGSLMTEATIGAHNSNLTAWATLVLNPGGQVKVGSLAGADTRLVTAASSGMLGTMPYVPASASADGYLKAADWTTFNNKFTLPALTAGSIPFFDGTTLAQRNTKLFWSEGNDRLGIGTNTPSKTVEISGLAGLKVSSLGAGATYDWIAGDFGGTSGPRVVMGNYNNLATIGAHTSNLGGWSMLSINPGGQTSVGSLAGTGTRMVVADPNGTLLTQPIPSPGGNGTVTNVTATAPLSVTNGTSTPNISLPKADGSTNGYLSSTDWATFNNKQNVLPFASQTANGILSSADWINFNNKLSASSLTAGSVVFGDGTSGLGQNNSKLFWNNSNFRLGVGTDAPQATLHVSGLNGLRVNSTNTGSGIVDWIAANFGGTAGARVVAGNLEGKATIGAHNQALNGWEKLVINPGGATVIGNLAGNGIRQVVANAEGELMTSSTAATINGLTNGLSLVGTAGELGGLLSKNTRINLDSMKLSFNNTTGTAIIDLNLVAATPGVSTGFTDIWQSFTPNITGGLSELTINLATHNGLPAFKPYTLSVYKGSGIAGQLLFVTQGIMEVQSSTSPVNIATYRQVHLTAGQQYTFRIQTDSQIFIEQCYGCTYSGGVGQGNNLYSFRTKMAPEIQNFLFDDNKLAIGNISPTANLDVNGTLRLRNNAAAGKVLTSDALGNATWQNAGASGNFALNNFALSNDGSSNGIFINNAGHTAIGAAPNSSHRLEVAGTGGAKISSLNNGSGTTDWIATNVGGLSGDRVVSGNLNGKATIGAHNSSLNAWADLAINPTAGNTVTIGSDANANPAQSSNTGTLNRNLIVNGSIRQGFYSVPISVPANNVTYVTWTHNLGYGPIVMMSTDQNGGGGFMDYCNVTTFNNNLNETVFVIRNTNGSSMATGNLRWILVW